MTTRRRLKKEIDYAVSDLILDCMTYANLYQKPDDTDTTQIVQETMELRNKLRNMANHPEQKDNSESSKTYYDNIAKTLVEGVDKGYGKLGKLVNKAE
ncbi:MAG TPA: hypothetical protein DCL77_04710 [Prolixibacteraceae bacterium]|jgi:hypothetical protein|nr:hypothetical protein [Prolixibacteraceae bacterium]